jgi:hypothetical protein
MKKNKKVETPTVTMFAIRKIPKNIPDFATLTYWKDTLHVYDKSYEIVKVTITPESNYKCL